MRRIWAAATALALLCAGCSAPEFPQMLESYPSVAAREDMVLPPKSANYSDGGLRLTLASGLNVAMYDGALVELVMKNWGTPRLETSEPATFANRLDILRGEEESGYSFAMASDGKALLRDDMGRSFAMPQYVYYALENSLLPYGLTMNQNAIRWAPEVGGSALQLEYYLPHLIFTLKVPQMGYAQAYFTNIKMYEARVAESGNSAKIYMLCAVAGYDMQNGVFSRTLRDIRPACLSLAKQGGVWRMSAYQEAADTSSFESIRQALPYEHAVQAVEDMRNNQGILIDLHNQATEYLVQSGLGQVEVEE